MLVAEVVEVAEDEREVERFVLLCAWVTVHVVRITDAVNIKRGKLQICFFITFVFN